MRVYNFCTREHFASFKSRAAGDVMKGKKKQKKKHEVYEILAESSEQTAIRVKVFVQAQGLFRQEALYGTVINNPGMRIFGLRTRMRVHIIERCRRFPKLQPMILLDSFYFYPFGQMFVFSSFVFCIVRLDFAT